MAKTSHSQNNTYLTCPKHWYLSYKEGYENPVQGASLFFGSAVDAAVTDMLEGKTDWENTFSDRWYRAFNFGKATQIFDNDEVVFGHKDFDKDVIESKDFIKMETWAKELNLIAMSHVPSHSELLDLYKNCADTKKNPYKTVSKEQLKYFNRCSWLSLKRKGKILLKAFNTQFYPKITRVIATQQRADIKDPNTGDTITGFIDMVLEIKGYDKPIIFDLKTAALPYSQDDIDLTQQLTLYAAMKGKDYNTDLVGYVVLCKNIPKEVVGTCTICAQKRTGRHKTCDAVDSNGNRCNGAWLETNKPAPIVQVLIEKKTQAQVDDLLIDIGNIMLAMDNQIVYKNVSKCNDWYGSRCPFFNLCHKGDATGLIKKK